jgi:hypothetical protein
MELPEYVRDDPRIGRRVKTTSGDVGTIESVLRRRDGTEKIQIIDESTGCGTGGLLPEHIIYID